jgi:hypothetical protein
MASPPSGLDALHALVSRYASLHSYRDGGRAIQARAGEDPKFSVWFSTFYRRPLFRFEFRRSAAMAPLREGSTQHAVTFDGRRAHQIRNSAAGDEVTALDSFETAVARATGISQGSSHTIARLLVPEMGGLSYLDLRNVALKDMNSIDGCECYVVTADHPNHAARYELWIERDRLLLRKRIADHGTWLSEERRENIRIDEPIGEDIFSSPVSAALPCRDSSACAAAAP